MEHSLPHAEHTGNKNEVRNVTVILSVLTLIELALGYVMYKWVNDGGFLRSFIKGTIIILMIAKAYYIVSYFMHLGHELRNLIMTIIVPLSLFVWFIIAFLYDGNSFKNNQNNYDRYKNEKRNTQAPEQHKKAGENKEHKPGEVVNPRD